MSKTHQQLLFTIDNGDQPCDARLSNIANPKSSKKWLMNSPQDFFIFSLKFQVPSTVFFVEMKGLNTYKLDLTFKDHNRKFLCQKNFIFEAQDELKLVEIWQHPYSSYVDVKLLNNRYTPMRMGLNYIAFKGKFDPLLVPEPNPIIKPKPVKHSQIFKDRQTAKQRNEIVLAIDDAGDKHKDIYFEEEEEQKRNNHVRTLTMNEATIGPTQPIPQVNQSIVVDPQTFPEHEHAENVFPLTYEELETQIIEPSSLKKGYVTYAYDESKQWWNILKFVRKEWVEGQKNIENEKRIAVEDRMSDKIQVKHLFRKKIMAEGLDPERRNIIEQSAVLMGATLKTEVEPGCLVVTTRQYGEKLRKMKKFKVAKIVTEEYIFNCKRFNALLNEEDYIIR